MEDIFDIIKRSLAALKGVSSMIEEHLVVRARPLSVEEAVGNPEEKDFPLQKGKESLMQAEFRGSMGQAFTDLYGDFEGSLGEVLQMRLDNNYRRAIFTATLNALLCSLGMTDKTVHCRDQEPRRCAGALLRFLEETHPAARITQVGFQPRMIEALGRRFALRVLDLDPDNIGSEAFGVPVQGPDQQSEALEWADLLLVTGTTLVNNTIGSFLVGKPIIFYGTTIAGAACLMGWQRFCAEGH